MNRSQAALHRLVLTAACEEQDRSARQLGQRVPEIDAIPDTSLYPVCHRLVGHGYLASTGQLHQRRYRRTPRGTAYLQVLELGLAPRHCRVIQGLGPEPAPLAATVHGLVQEGRESPQNVYNHLRDLVGLGLAEVTGLHLHKRIRLTDEGVIKAPLAARALRFWDEAS